MQFIPADRLWTVGYYEPGGRWHAVSDHGSQEEAASYIRYLNGGSAIKWELFLELGNDRATERLAGAEEDAEDDIDTAIIGAPVPGSVDPESGVNLADLKGDF